MKVLESGGVTSARGFRAGAVAAGIKKNGAPDLCIVLSDRDAAAAGVFTRNQVRAAPVRLSEQRLAAGTARGVVVNAGNANACTGAQGVRDAEEMTALSAARYGLAPETFLVASTGVIGVNLPMEKVRDGIARIAVSVASGHEAALAIMTTDTRSKERAVQIEIQGRTVTIGGMAKGSGMIHPNMATMLGFITTDAAVDPTFLRDAVHRAADVSFNLISVDGDTSTNDTLIVLANGAAENPTITAGTPDAVRFQEALDDVAIDLAKAIARDGEGATKLIEMVVDGARSTADARKAARAVVSSSLFKAAVYGADPNWGRILCALGYSGAEVDAERADIRIGDVYLMRGGEIQPFDKAHAAAQLKGPDVYVFADLHLGDASARAWGCDLTEEYVDINGRYTT